MLTPWNKDKPTGQKAPLTCDQIDAIRFRLKCAGQYYHLALFNLAIDSKLMSCDLVQLKVADVSDGLQVISRVSIIQQRTQHPMKFEITKKTREALENWILYKGLSFYDYLFPSRTSALPHITTRQYARIVKKWAESINIECSTYSLRRAKLSIVYKKTKNLKVVQHLAGHMRLRSVANYIHNEEQEIDINDALRISEQTKA